MLSKERWIGKLTRENTYKLPRTEKGVSRQGNAVKSGNNLGTAADDVHRGIVVRKQVVPSGKPEYHYMSRGGNHWQNLKGGGFYRGSPGSCDFTLHL